MIDYLAWRGDLTFSQDRLNEIDATDFKDILDRDRVIQFAAITFSIDENHSVVSFRGTDTSAIGWKEDCMLSYSDEIPGQTEALSYFENQNLRKKYNRKQQEILRRALKIFLNSLRKGSIAVLDAELRPVLSPKADSQ